MKFFRRKPKQPDNVRAHYRCLPDKKHGLRAKLTLPGGKAFGIEISDLSAGGAGVSFSRDSDPGLAVDDPVTLTFTSLKATSDVTVEARIANRPSEDPGSRYGVCFTNLTNFFESLDAIWFHSFNRRREMRALPPLDARIRLTFQNSGTDHRALMKDVSPAGLCAVAEGDHAQAIGKLKYSEGVLELGKGSTPIPLIMELKHQRESSKGVIFGVSLEWPKDKKGRAMEKQLLEYTKSRLEDMARWSQARKS